MWQQVILTTDKTIIKLLLWGWAGRVVINFIIHQLVTIYRWLCLMYLAHIASWCGGTGSCIFGFRYCHSCLGGKDVPMIPTNSTAKATPWPPRPRSIAARSSWQLPLATHGSHSHVFGLGLLVLVCVCPATWWAWCMATPALASPGRDVAGSWSSSGHLFYLQRMYTSLDHRNPVLDLQRPIYTTYICHLARR